MISLSQYLMEARQLVGNLPFTFDEFVEFISAVSDFDDDAEIYKMIQSRIETQYGESIWRSFLGWIEAQSYNGDPEKMYKVLQKYPVDRLERLLGSGSFGAAISLGKDKVIKWMHPGMDMEKNDLIFWEWCASHDSKYFPKVYRINNPRYVILEKVKANTPKCNRYWKSYNTRMDIGASKTQALWHVANQLARMPKILDGFDVQGAIDRLSKEDREFWDWYYGAELEAARGGFVVADFKPSNIGERPDGSIVWFDV